MWKALFTTLVVFLFAFGVLLTFVPDQAVAVGVRTGVLIALLPASSAVAIGLVAPRMDGVLARHGERGVALLALLAYTLGLLAFIEAGTFVWLLVGALLLGVGHGLLFPLSQAMLAREAPSQGSVLFLSLNITAIGVSQTLSPLLMSAVYDQFGLRSVFVVALAVSLALVPLSWIFLRRFDAAQAI